MTQPTWSSVPAVRLVGSDREVALYYAPSGVLTIERSRGGRTVNISDVSIDWLVDRLFAGTEIDK